MWPLTRLYYLRWLRELIRRCVDENRGGGETVPSRGQRGVQGR